MTGPAKKKRDALVLKNQGLVYSIVQAHYPALLGTTGFDDFLQAGIVGLISAVDAALRDEIVGPFSKYARVCILSELQDLEAKSGGTLLPARDRRDRVRIRRKWSALQRELGRDPTADELRAAWESKKKPSDALIDRALAGQPRMLYGLDGLDGPVASVEVRVEEALDAKRTLRALDAIEPIDARLRRAS